MTRESSAQDAIDARRWRALKQRHAYALVRLATGGTSYNSEKAPAILDAWADVAIAEIKSFDPVAWHKESSKRIEELEAQHFGDA